MARLPEQIPSAAPGAPPLLTAIPTSVVLGVVVYFAVRVLLQSPGSILALVCLVLMGLTVGNTVRRSGLRSLPALLLLAAAVLGGGLAFVFRP